MTKPSDVLPPIEEKRSYVQQMFTDIAPRYDLMNRVMTLGQDRMWRRTVIELCNLPRYGRLLDVATGTGDIGYEALRRDLSVDVVGVDLAREMMLRGRGKAGDLAFPFATTDALSLPFADNSFDAATSGFMMRNVIDIAAAFREQARVVKPGGRVVCLEITLPRAPVFGPLFRFYFFKVVPLIGGALTGQRQAYTYLPHSALKFPQPAALAQIMRAAGLRDVAYRLAMPGVAGIGTVAIHWGTK